MPYTVTLKKNHEKRIAEGHPWVYANEVASITGPGKNGDLANVYSADGRFLGSGYINHLSKILVRIFIRDGSFPDVDFYTKRIRAANDFRRKIGFCDGDSYRAVFAESDDLPGLIVDRYGDLLSVQILTLGVEKNREIIVQALKNVFGPRGIYARCDVAVREKEGLDLYKGPLFGEFTPETVITENGLKMHVDLENGQKTGYFLDQKENRAAVRRYAPNAEVLDCFCNVGGFSLNCAAAAAAKVYAADISERALDEVRKNAALNSLEDKIETVQADIFELLRRYNNENRKFGLVILDPPAFSKSKDEADSALRGYKTINKSALKLVAPGGFLVSASCTHFISVASFLQMLSDAARESGRRVRLVEMKTQSPDHASLMAEKESLYLKFFVLAVE